MFMVMIFQTMRDQAIRTGLIVMVTAVLAATPSFGQPLPLVNLGGTGFMDGMPAKPGFNIIEYLVFYQSDRFNDARGNAISGGIDLRAATFITQLNYQSDQAVFFGGNWGLSGLFFYSLDDGSFDSDGSGVRDLVLGGSIQWDLLVRNQKPIFSHRLELDFSLPTGRYDSDRFTNSGSNAYSFNPYWSATWFVTPPWTISWRLHYLYNGENDDPNPFLYPGARDIQAGQAIHLNFASSFGVTKDVRLGVAGYFLTQFTDAKVDGRSVPNSREEVLAIGPGMVWEIGDGNYFMANAYHELYSENRPQGSQVVVKIFIQF